jgi:hypothetical protein
MRVVVAATLLAGVLPGTAAAADSYWDQQCTNGGWTFNTCASAWVTTSGQNQVTIRIWNLAGIPGSNTFANAAFTAIGLNSLGSGLVFQNLAVTYPNGSVYSGWSFANGGGGIPGPVGSNGVTIQGVGSSIFSQWAVAPLPGSGTPAITNWAGPGQFNSGFVAFTFNTYTQVCTGHGVHQQCTLTPALINLTNAVLGLHVQSGPNGQSTGYECLATNPSPTATIGSPCIPPATVTPEPVTTALLGTGLGGLGLVQLRRRRRQNA